MQQFLKDYLTSKMCKDVVNMINDDYIIPYYKDIFERNSVVDKFLELNHTNKVYFGGDGFGEKNVKFFFVKILPKIPYRLLEHVKFKSYEDREVDIKFKVGDIRFRIFLDADIFISYENISEKDYESLEEEYFIDEDEAMKYIEKKFEKILKKF